MRLALPVMHISLIACLLPVFAVAQTAQENAWTTLDTGLTNSSWEKRAKAVRPRLTSLSHSFTLDLALGFQLRADAMRFLEEFKERLAKFGLELHPEKTRLIEFGRYAATTPALSMPAADTPKSTVGCESPFR